jgi:drug/metabolite transporter (DMT)-like permease
VLEPLTGTILAAVLLSERLSVTGVAGAAIIAMAVLLTVRANRGGGRPRTDGGRFRGDHHDHAG